jgi:ABC-type sugar transport system ATPase subunit
MNLFPAHTIALAGVTLPQHLASANDRTLTAGIRPEHLRLADGTSGTVLPVIVEHVEWLGHETLAYVRTQQGSGDDTLRLVARLPGMQALTKDDAVSLQIDPSHLHFFGEDGGAVVTYSAPATRNQTDQFKNKSD